MLSTMPDTHLPSPPQPALPDDPLARHRGLVRRVAHDLNNALMLPLTLGSLLVENLPDGQNRTDAHAIIGATLRARELVRLLQALTRPGGPQSVAN
jgi:hypothetical protein